MYLDAVGGAQAEIFPLVLLHHGCAGVGRAYTQQPVLTDDVTRRFQGGQPAGEGIVVNILPVDELLHIINSRIGPLPHRIEGVVGQPRPQPQHRQQAQAQAQVSAQQ